MKNMKVNRGNNSFGGLVHPNHQNHGRSGQAKKLPGLHIKLLYDVCIP